MLLSLTDQQQLIEASALSFLAKECDRHGPLYGSDAAPLTPRLWQSFAEMGWLGLPLSEANGGFGGGAVDTGLLMRALGRYRVKAPYHGCVLLAARLMAELGSSAQTASWLPALIDGSKRLALAHDEPHCHSPWAERATRAVPQNHGWRLSGRKLLAYGAPGADALLVSACVPATLAGPARALLFLVSANASGLRQHHCRTADDALAADVYLDDVYVGEENLLGQALDDSGRVLHRILAEGLVSQCWEACGAMRAALDQTVAYTSQRQQFGRPMATFQVVQHRLAEMAVRCEMGQAAAELAAMRIDRGAQDVLATASMAKSKVGRAARYVAKEAVQLHGAMGVSEEMPIAGLFRGLTLFQQQGGATAWHGEQFGRHRIAQGQWRESQTLLPSHLYPSALAAIKEQVAR